MKRAIRRAVRLALSSRHVRRLVRAELTAVRPASPESPPSGPTGAFVDCHGVSHPLDPALRDRLKPQWRTMCDPVAANRPPSDQVILGRVRAAGSTTRNAAALIAASTGLPFAGRILEVGCYDGAAAFQIARLGVTEIVASDLARYYVAQRPGQPLDTAIADQQVVLAELRERTGLATDVDPGLVRFVEDDITDSRLEPGSFDAIVSFEVLEHVQHPGAAFASMARLLRPGGLAYHDYNPFFSVNGGHSLCTLDFPWGHARLDDRDFERYVRELRPSEVDQALRFYRESLNRMTLADLRTAVSGAGLELLELIPWTDRKLAALLGPDVVEQVRRSHPDAGAEDLLATFITVIARRPIAIAGSSQA